MKSKYATLRVTSNPSGAAVILDGIHHGRTPCSVDDVLVATHTLKLVKDGFHDYEEQIKPSQTADFTLSVELKERLASLDISSTPADARVTIDNEFKGRTPLQVKGLRDGKYNLAIEKPSFGRFSRVVEIKNNQDGAVEANLANTEGKLALKVSPPGSNIMVESESRGLSTENPFELDLEPGAYKIQVSKNGYQSQTLKAEVRVGKTTEINVNLRHPWVKDTTLLLKNKRVREGMMISKYPNGGIRIETAPGIFEEFTADEIESNSPIK